MTFHVRILPKAEADVRSITRYLYTRSPQGAAVWLTAYERAKSRLSEFADGCGEADENEFLDIDVKQSLFKTRRGRVYRLLFTILDDEVCILRVRGSGQAPVQSEDL